MNLTWQMPPMELPKWRGFTTAAKPSCFEVKKKKRTLTISLIISRAKVQLSVFVLLFVAACARACSFVSLVRVGKATQCHTCWCHRISGDADTERTRESRLIITQHLICPGQRQISGNTRARCRCWISLQLMVRLMSSVGSLK